MESKDKRKGTGRSNFEDESKANKRESSIKSRDYSKRRLRIGTLLILVFLAIYIPALYHWKYGTTTKTDIIQLGTIEDVINTNSVIVRDEIVLKSPFEGSCIAQVDEGDKIPAHYCVATVLKKSSSGLLTSLKEIDMRIIKAQNKKLDNVKIFSGDLAKIDDGIAEVLKVVIADQNKNSLINETRYKANIDELIRKRATILGGTETSNAYISSLLSQSNSLQKQINSNTKKVTSDASGIVSYIIDGYEDILSFKSIKDLTPDFLSNLDVSNAINNVKNTSVYFDQPFIKVIRSAVYNILVTLTIKDSKLFKTGTSVQLRINEIGKLINGDVEYVSRGKDDKCILSIRTNEALSETAGMRKINIDLIKSRFEGYKVPLASLRNVDSKLGKALIVLVNANKADIREVALIGKNDETAIIGNFEDRSSSAINLYDTYVLSPVNITEGQMVSQ